MRVTVCFIEVRPLVITKECLIRNQFSYFWTKAYVVGTQKNRLIETVF